MPIEYKALPSFTMGIDGRSATGIFAVHGNIDSGNDRSHPGLFGSFLTNGRKRAVFLWQHDSDAPPIATIDSVFEVGMADLPPAVKLYAPDATGGVAVKRTYLDTPRANEVLAGLTSGAISEMSYAYEPTRWDTENTGVRNIYESDLYDVSDVNWGMNPATSATGAKGMPLAQEHVMVRATINRYIKRLEELYALRAKAGRQFSSASIAEIDESVSEIESGIARLKRLIAAPEPSKSTMQQTQDAYREWQALQGRIRSLGVAL